MFKKKRIHFYVFLLTKFTRDWEYQLCRVGLLSLTRSCLYFVYCGIRSSGQSATKRSMDRGVPMRPSWGQSSVVTSWQVSLGRGNTSFGNWMNQNQIKNTLELLLTCRSFRNFNDLYGGNSSHIFVVFTCNSLASISRLDFQTTAPMFVRVKERKST